MRRIECDEEVGRRGAKEQPLLKRLVIRWADGSGGAYETNSHLLALQLHNNNKGNNSNNWKNWNNKLMSWKEKSQEAEEERKDDLRRSLLSTRGVASGHRLKTNWEIESFPPVLRLISALSLFLSLVRLMTVESIISPASGFPTPPPPTKHLTVGYLLPGKKATPSGYFFPSNLPPSNTRSPLRSGKSPEIRRQRCKV